ncbi:AraC family transcriptional regulator [Rhizobium sp. FKL33]|jgi:AraC family transcriptional regulator|uniref:helix-turn-helix domain-containing protein n=1 Tax=Rhizobium sp. FKL33 TaxID=2562307 RepID=UPI0010C0E305|nr:AraC family transcriptional regulator [Rhizobium sp. FKL33]
MDRLYDHGSRKFPQAGLLATSKGRGWSNIAAELRRHPKGQIPDFCAQQTEITFAVDGARSGRVHRRGDSRPQSSTARSGTIWLCPAGVREEEIVLTEDLPLVFHLYLPDVTPDEDGGSALKRLAYAADVDDELIRQICFRIASELREESSGGSLLVEQLAIALGTHLRSRYCDAYLGSIRPEKQAPALDHRRMRRVIDYVEAHLFENLTVSELAEIACLSRSHFARAFKAALGEAPSDYIGARRLEFAKTMLGDESLSLAEIAQTCCFSSQAAFTRAFKKNTGKAPGAFRRRASG